MSVFRWSELGTGWKEKLFSCEKAEGRTAITCEGDKGVPVVQNESPTMYQYRRNNYYARTPIHMNTREREEVEQLVAQCRARGFRTSAQVGYYIRDNRLGERFPHIAGYLKLAKGDDSWEFDGGIAPKFYREVCTRLGLGNAHSNASVVGFSSYAERGLF